MSSTLPIVDPCCLTTCDDVVVQNIPGPAGDTGAAGAAGADGVNAYTVLTLAFTMPAEGAGATATVGSTAWITAGQIVYIAGLGYLTATTILSGTTFTATNLENTASGTYTSNAAPGTIAAIGSKVSPAGIQGPAGTVGGGTLVGDVTGTIGANELTIAATLGALPVGNGSKAQSLSKGTDGEILCSDAAAALDLDWKPIIPSTGAANLADNRILRLDGATGLPIPLQSSLVTINDQGAITADGSGGNARGTDAIDLQVTRGAATQVASGTRSMIAGGQNNTASGGGAVVAGGSNNTASNTESVVAGGDGNTASGIESAVCGGNNNLVSATQSFIGGGLNHQVTAAQSAVCGGEANTISAIDAFIGGGISNSISQPAGSILGGTGNGVSGSGASVIGGESNDAIGAYSVACGFKAQAQRYGEFAHSTGSFASDGDQQCSHLVWMIATTDATANVEMFLNSGATARATIPSNQSWVFDILLVGRSSAGVAAAWRVTGAINNNAGTTALVAGVTTTVLADGTGGTWGLAANFVVDADNVNDALRLRVTGAGATNIRWVANGRIGIVGY